jgi:DNA-directed RNA polymerase, mitochondrial
MPWRHDASTAEDEAELPPGRQLLRLAIEPTAEAMREFCNRIGAGGAGREREAHLILSQIGHEEAAYLTGRIVLNAVATGMKLTATANEVATAFIEHIEMSNLRRNRRDAFDGLIRSQRTSRTMSYKKRKAIKNTLIEHGADQEYSLAIRTRTGVKAIQLFCDATGLFVIESAARGTKVIRPTEAVHQWLERQHARCELLEPIHLPMIVRPRRWVSPFKGGYITKRPGSRLVKQWHHAYHDYLRDVDMPEVYAAVNAVQDTAWRINTRVLSVMRAIWDEGGELGGLPRREPLPLPDRPEEFSDELSLKRWKRAAADIHSANSSSMSKRLSISQRLWVADKFADEGAIYYPHELDFRGRMYPIPVSGPHPQGDDTAKGLLEFAEGHPITAEGANWLAVHLANMFGHDKLSFKERLDWVFENTPAIIDSAVDPLDGRRFWATADNPFMALAACFEWHGYMTEGEAYVSHLPVSLDGSNSGLQHFSALLRDPVGAKAVNLTPADRPADIYADVARAVQAKVDAVDDDAPLAVWKHGRVTRKIAKRPCMTFTYSATRFGMHDMVFQTLRELDSNGQPHLGGADNYDGALCLSHNLFTTISETVIAASTAMDWLRQAAKVMTAAGLPIWWTTPAGLPVLQIYRNRKQGVVRVIHHAKIVELNVSTETKKLDGRRQANGISPNFVHSLDAAHLMAVANGCRARGILDIAVVHDSFGVHAAHAYDLRDILRETFAEQYGVDRLAMLRDELAAQLPPEFVDLLPPLPALGDFDINEVLRADYLFG